jgi:4-hydroxy-2-oxoheptanedioate aldolase
MQMPVNRFKQALQGHALASARPQIGLWVALAHAYATEMVAAAGFDWLLLDAEHAPNDVRSVLAQLQVLAAYPQVSPIVRPPSADPNLIKQLLDIGAQTLLVPMVETAEQARTLVAAMRYPPQGFRGVGSALARASRFNQVPQYLLNANDQMCLIVQVETARGLANLDEIAAVEGVDGIFIGPADLAASLGHLGQIGHPDVVAAIEGAFERILRAGKAPGFLAVEEALARRSLALGCRFLAVGTDVGTLVGGVRALAAKFL